MPLTFPSVGKSSFYWPRGALESCFKGFARFYSEVWVSGRVCQNQQEYLLYGFSL